MLKYEAVMLIIKKGTLMVIRLVMLACAVFQSIGDILMSLIIRRMAIFFIFLALCIIS